MPQAPKQYKPPTAGNADVEQYNGGKSQDDNQPNRYAHRRYRKFRARIKKKRRAQDEERIHDIYDNLNSRSFKDYMLWLQDDNPLCVDCLEKGLIKPGRAMDHITAIEDGGSVYDERNLQFLCDYHHGIKSGKEAHGERSKIRIIAGAPGSGKSTYVKNHVKPGDLVVDIDEIYKALSFQPLYKKPEALKDIVFRVRDRIYRAIREKNSIKRAWVIVSYPEASKRKELKEQLNGSLYLVDCPSDVCKERIRKQRRTSGVDWDKVVDQWYKRFEPLEDEEAIIYD